MSDLKNMPTLSDDAAQKLLENVFDACETEPNTVPLATLESYSEYRRERYSLQKIILIIILAVFLALPYCFIAPTFSITKVSDEDARIPNYEIKVDGKFPIKFISATINGHNVTVYETGNRTYSVEPTENGIMDVQVNLINKQYNVDSVEVSGIDNSSPYLVSDKKVGDELHITLADDGLGIDFDSVYAETNSGEVIYPKRVNKDTGLVVFDIPKESINIFVTDFKDNELQLVITIV